MPHIKEITIYEKGETRVYIHQCQRNFKWDKVKKKTETYGIRRDDKTGFAHWLGAIRWSGAWRQYVFEPEPNTQWSSGCKKKMCEFEDMINTRHRNKLKKARNSNEMYRL